MDRLTGIPCDDSLVGVSLVDDELPINLTNVPN